MNITKHSVSPWLLAILIMSWYQYVISTSKTMEMTRLRRGEELVGKELHGYKTGSVIFCTFM